MMQYLVGYRLRPFPLQVMHYRFSADDAAHALEQFRNAEPDKDIEVVYVIVEGPCA